MPPNRLRTLTCWLFLNGTIAVPHLGFAEDFVKRNTDSPKSGLGRISMPNEIGFYSTKPIPLDRSIRYRDVIHLQRIRGLAIWDESQRMANQIPHELSTPAMFAWSRGSETCLLPEVLFADLFLSRHPSAGEVLVRISEYELIEIESDYSPLEQSDTVSVILSQKPNPVALSLKRSDSLSASGVWRQLQSQQIANERPEFSAQIKDCILKIVRRTESNNTLSIFIPAAEQRLLGLSLTHHLDRFHSIPILSTDQLSLEPVHTLQTFGPFQWFPIDIKNAVPLHSSETDSKKRCWNRRN